MSLVDVDSWVIEYEACDRLCHIIQNQIFQRDRENILSAEYSSMSSNIRLKLKQLDNEVEQLKVKLNMCNRNQSITVEETERRQRQIETLQSRLLHLHNKFKSVSPSQTDRNILIPTTASALWDDEEDEPIISDIPSTSIADIRRHQIQAMEAQNEGLEELSKTISRQKKLASRMGTEIIDQNEILDDLADNMERIDARVGRETGAIGTITQQDSTWRYWTIIIILFIVIIIVQFAF